MLKEIVLNGFLYSRLEKGDERTELGDGEDDEGDEERVELEDEEDFDDDHV